VCVCGLDHNESECKSTSVGWMNFSSAAINQRFFCVCVIEGPRVARY
jgi:hypothetical protein